MIGLIFAISGCLGFVTVIIALTVACIWAGITAIVVVSCCRSLFDRGNGSGGGGGGDGGGCSGCDGGDGGCGCGG